MHPGREQFELLGRGPLLGRRRVGCWPRLSRLPADCVDTGLPHLHRVSAEHDVQLSDLLLHFGRCVRERPLHSEHEQRQLRQLHWDGHRRRARLHARAELRALHGKRWQ